MIINNVPFNCSLEDIITELKEQLSLNGIQLLNTIKDSGNDIMISCPYHKDGQERKPSAGIRKSDGQMHCFACGETHSLQEVISHCFGWEDTFAIQGWKWLLKNFATIEIEHRKAINLDYSRDKKEVKNVDYVTEQELDSYRFYHPYMYKRKLTDEIIETFDIGYDKKSKCITFPQRDINGNTLFIARRSVNTKYFNYPTDVDKPVYGVYELYQLEQFPQEIIVCESMLDALFCWVNGKYAVALNGLGTKNQFDVISSFPCRKIILATDNDEAGMRARVRIKKYIKNKIITEYMLPENKKDINDLTVDEFNNLEEVL